jgi:hypothetical protein
MTHQGQTQLVDRARFIRSKNAGPFQVAIDVVFATERDFATARRSGLLSREAVAAAYRVSENEVIGVQEWDAALAIKVTLRRAVSAGAPGDTDCYGAQQHGPLATLLWPLDGDR